MVRLSARFERRTPIQLMRSRFLRTANCSPLRAAIGLRGSGGSAMAAASPLSKVTRGMFSESPGARMVWRSRPAALIAQSGSGISPRASRPKRSAAQRARFAPSRLWEPVNFWSARVLTNRCALASKPCLEWRGSRFARRRMLSELSSRPALMTGLSASGARAIVHCSRRSSFSRAEK